MMAAYHQKFQWVVFTACVVAAVLLVMSPSANAISSSDSLMDYIHANMSGTTINILTPLYNVLDSMVSPCRLRGAQETNRSLTYFSADCSVQQRDGYNSEALLDRCSSEITFKHALK